MRMLWFRDKESTGPKKRQGVIDLLFTRARMHWWLLAATSALVVVWVAFPMEDQRRLLSLSEFELGEKSPKDVAAQIDFTYNDESATEEKKQEAVTEIPPVFHLDFQRLDDAEYEFEKVREVRRDYPTADARKKVDMMKRLFVYGPTAEAGLILATASDEQIDAMERNVAQVLSNILEGGVVAAPDGYGRGSFTEELSKIDYMKPKWERIRKRLREQTGLSPTNDQVAAMIHVSLVGTRSDPYAEKKVLVQELRLWLEATRAARDMAKEMPEPISTVVKDMCVGLMRPNLVYEPALTKKRQTELLSNFPPVSQQISKGDEIIGIGEIVTESRMGKLQAISSAQRRAMLRAIPGAALLTAFLSLILIVYLRKYEPSIFSEPRKILALSAAILLILVLGNLLIIWGPTLNIDRPGFLIPAALASIVVAMLTNAQLAILVTCIIGVLVAMLAGVNLAGSLQYFLVILAGGATAAISSTRIRHRRHLMAAGVYVSGANVVTILGLGLLESASLAKLGTNCLLGAVNGVTVAVLTPGLLPIFEYLSRTTTDMELLELADLNQPLLTQLKEKASGTYYHSISVAELAEASAEAVGANPLLTRVGAYYHDIGKMTKPEYFIENQKGENVHDTLNPSMSSRVISNHIKDGIRIANEYKLPHVVQDIVQQHHGTTLIGGRRFYQKAVEADKHNTVKIKDYRYPGPKPQTKEAAIVHVADSIESARRVAIQGNPTYSRLVTFVREIIEGKIMDSQLDESDLTLRDISLMADASVKVLSGMYHTRIEYPKEVEAVRTHAGSSPIEEQSGGENG